MAPIRTIRGYHLTTEGELYCVKTGRKKYTWKNKGRSSVYERVQFIVEGKPKNFYIHRLVAEMYLSAVANMQVDHIDGNTLNNNVDNLRVVTCQENQLHYQAQKRIKKTIRGTSCVVKEGRSQVYMVSA
jgi:hypothetical protein